MLARVPTAQPTGTARAAAAAKGMIAKAKEKGKGPEAAAAAAAAADARAITELRRPRGPPGPRLASSPTANPSRSSGPGEADLQSALRENQELRDYVSVPFSSVRAAVNGWKGLTEEKAIIKVIKHGVGIPLVQIPQPPDLPPRGELGPLTSVINESIRAGAVQPLAKSKARSTKHWILMSAVRKRDGGQSRLISQFNKLNTCFPCPSFKPDSWKTVQELLQYPTLCWGATADMANWFHHQDLSTKARRWARFKFPGRAYEMTALPFGLASSPY